MDSKDYTDELYSQLRMEQKKSLQASLTLIGVREWLAKGEETEWKNPIYMQGAMAELRAYFNYLEKLKEGKRHE